MTEELERELELKFLVVDDHELLLNGTIVKLKEYYPKAEIFTASTSEMALIGLGRNSFNLAVIDLSLPEKLGKQAKTENGIQMLKNIMRNYPNLNIMVQSTYVKALIRIIPEIDNHKGGFAIADKSLTSVEMLKRLRWSLDGLTCTKDLKEQFSDLELKKEWLTVLTLAFEEGLQDKAIAQKTSVTERMVRVYWSKIQDALNVYPEENQNIRILTEKKAREAGILD